MPAIGSKHTSFRIVGALVASRPLVNSCSHLSRSSPVYEVHDEVQVLRYTAMLEKVGVPVERIGDSTGALDMLSGI